MRPVLKRLEPLIEGIKDRRSGSPRWTVADLIDFEYYVGEDEQRLRDDPGERKRVAGRDRRLYRERIAPALEDLAEHSPKHRNRALRLWLQARRGNEDEGLGELLPGAAFERGQRLVTYGIGLLGFAAGITVASALLQYDGQRPVNVSWYIFWLVLLQILLAGTTAALWFGRRSSLIRGAAQDISLFAQLFRPLFTRTARWIQHQRIGHLPPDLRERAQAKRGLLGGQFALYGPAALLPMLIPAQVFGIGFNLGAILITIALEWFTDMAFGWGSALDVSPATIHGLAQAIALPWSWLFGEGAGLPTLEQVAGTRISLKDPLFVLDAEHLRSWRWFLVLAVFTYGLLPRLILLGWSVLRQRLALNALPFTHQSAQATYARMITPSLSSAAQRSGTGPEMPIPGPLVPLTAPTAAPRPPKPAPTQTKPPPQPAAVITPPAAPERAGGQATETGAAPADKATAAAPPAAPQRPAEPARPSHRPAARGADASTQGSATTRTAESAPEAQRPKGRGSTPAAAPPDTAETAPPAPTPEAGAAHHEPGTEAPGEQPRAPVVPTPAAARQPTPAADPGGDRTRTSATRVAADACVLLLHIDVADLLGESDHGRLQGLLREQAGWRVAAAATYGGGRAMADQALALIAGAQWAEPPARVALLQDGSQPPITENLRFLRSVRATAGPQAQILLALIGDPEDDDSDPLPPLRPFDFADWQRKIEQLGDPYLRLCMLAGASDEAP